MAKKKSKKKSQKEQCIPENILPQNILPVGERVEENKNIYISQAVYKEIHKFTKNKTVNESGGMLIGNVIEEFGKTNIVINGFIEAKYSESTPTTLKFTHESWEYCHKVMEEKFHGQKIVGWIHTHPDFGIFLSEYDKFIQDNFFKEDYQIAYVIDPIQGIEGFYFWINEKIERCKGFYIFDKTGAKISINDNKEEQSKKETTSLFNIKNIIIAFLVVCVVFLFFLSLSQNSKIETLQKQQETIVESANQSLTYLQQQMNELSSRIDSLEKETIKDIEAKEESAVTENSEDKNGEAESTSETLPSSKPMSEITGDTADE